MLVHCAYDSVLIHVVCATLQVTHVDFKKAKDKVRACSLLAVEMRLSACALADATPLCVQVMYKKKEGVPEGLYL